METENEEEIVEGQVRNEDITEKEKILLEWAKESWKNNIDTYNKILKLLLNMIIPLFSGLIVFFNYIEIYSNDCWYYPFIFLSLSFVSSLIGILPFTKEINIINATEIDHFRNNTLKRKKYSMIISLFFLFLSFLIVINLIS